MTGHLADQVSLKIGNIYQIQKKYEQAVGCFQKVMDSPCIDCRRRAHLHLMETYEALFDFERAIAVIRSLDASPENQPIIAREVARLNERQSEVEAGRMPRAARGQAAVTDGRAKSLRNVTLTVLPARRNVCRPR